MPLFGATIMGANCLNRIEAIENFIRMSGINKKDGAEMKSNEKNREYFV